MDGKCLLIGQHYVHSIKYVVLYQFTSFTILSVVTYFLVINILTTHHSSAYKLQYCFKGAHFVSFYFVLFGALRLYFLNHLDMNWNLWKYNVFFFHFKTSCNKTDVPSLSLNKKINEMFIGNEYTLQFIVFM